MMNRTEIFKKIGGILGELNEQYQYIAENPENFNELELELFSANADFLSEHSKILLKLTAKQEKAQAVAAPEHKTPAPRPEVFHPRVIKDEPVIPAPVVPIDLRSPAEAKELPSTASVFSNQSLKEVEESAVPKVQTEEVREPAPLENIIPLVEKPFIDEVVIKKQEESRAEIHKPEESKPAGFAAHQTALPVQPETPFVPASSQSVQAAPTVPPVYQQPSPEPQTVGQPHGYQEHKAVPTLNDLISEQRAQHAASTVQFRQRSATDLKAMVSLNDKLLFIKDLFNGYSLAYSEAIEILNRFDTFDAADKFLKANYAEKNNWASKPLTVEKFNDILHKKFNA